MDPSSSVNATSLNKRFYDIRRGIDIRTEEKRREEKRREEMNGTLPKEDPLALDRKS